MSDAKRTKDEEALTVELAAFARDAAGPAGAGPEPEADELLDYLAGRLSPEADAALRRRLVASPEATRKLLDLAELDEASSEAGTARPGEPADLAVHAAWRDFERRLGKHPAAQRRAPPWLAGLAAALLLAVVGLGSWVWQLEHQAGQVVSNLRSLELAESVRSGEPATVALPSGEPLRLVLAPAEACPAYQAKLDGPGARRTLPGLERDELGRLTLLLRRAEPGSYTLRLSGCEPEREISTYRFEIVEPGGAT